MVANHDQILFYNLKLVLKRIYINQEHYNHLHTSLFLQYLGEIFEHSEVRSACVKDVTISRETMSEAGKKAFEACFHDLYSDIDISVTVVLPKNGSITPEEAVQMIKDNNAHLMAQ